MKPTKIAQSLAEPFKLAPDGYLITKQGVFIAEEDTPGTQLTLVPATVTAVIRNFESAEWCAKVVWLDPDGNQRCEIQPYTHLLSKTTELLTKRGLLVLPGKQTQFSMYIAACISLPSLPRVWSVSKLGFFEVPTLRDESGSPVLAFMLPGRCILPSRFTSDEHGPKELIQFHPPVQSTAYDSYSSRGDLESWKAMLEPHAENVMLVFAIAVGVAAPFMQLGGVDNVIFHFHGASSTGKTTALQVAASVWGCAADPQSASGKLTQIERWHATSNGLEPMMVTRSGILLAIDELGSHGDLSPSIYNTTSGRGKVRMNEMGGVRESHTWMVCALSSGEISIQAQLEAAAKRQAKAGEIIRANDIPTDRLTSNYSQTPMEIRSLIDALKEGCAQQNYGVAGPVFIEAMLDFFVTADALKLWLSESIEIFHANLVDAAKGKGFNLASAQIRALRRYAFVQAVADVACDTGVVPFTKEQTNRAIEEVAFSWLEDLPLLSEGERGLAMLRDSYVRWLAKILNLAAWAKMAFHPGVVPQDMRGIVKDDLLLLTKEQFKLACPGLNEATVLKYLSSQGFLKHEMGKLTYRVDIGPLGIKRQAFIALKMDKLFPRDPASADEPQESYHAPLRRPQNVEEPSAEAQEHPEM